MSTIECHETVINTDLQLQRKNILQEACPWNRIIHAVKLSYDKEYTVKIMYEHYAVYIYIRIYKTTFW